MQRQGIHSIWNIAKREMVRLVKHPIYIFCMLVAPLISLLFFVSLMREGLPADLPIAVVARYLSAGYKCSRQRKQQHR